MIVITIFFIIRTCQSIMPEIFYELSILTIRSVTI